MNNPSGSGNFIDMLSVFSKQILPVVGVVALIFLCMALWQLIKVIKSLDVTVDKVNHTIDNVDQSVDKLQVPLETLENISYSVDSVHEFTKATVIKSVDMITDNFAIVKDWATSLFKKDSVNEEDIVDVDDVL